MEVKGRSAGISISIIYIVERVVVLNMHELFAEYAWAICWICMNYLHKTQSNTTQKTKARTTRTPHETRIELKCSGKVSSSCSTSGTHRVTLITKTGTKSWTMKGPDFVISTSGTYPWSFVTQIFHNGQSSLGGDRKTYICDHYIMTILFQAIMLTKSNLI